MMRQKNPSSVVLHCSATPDSKESHYDVEWCRKLHMRKGWDDCGYHWYITRTGEIQQGRDEKYMGAHVRGKNRNRIGICYEGTYKPTDEQIDAIFILYNRFKEKYGIDSENWWGHRELINEGDPQKECPGFDMKPFREILRGLDNGV